MVPALGRRQCGCSISITGEAAVGVASPLDFTMSMTDRPIETGFVVLVPPGVSVDTNEFSATGDLDIAATYGDLPRTRLVSGQIQSVLLLGSMGLPAVPGWVYFFDEDPNTTAGDAALTAPIRGTIIGEVYVAASDWDQDNNGSTAYKQVDIDFHAMGIIYAVYRNLGPEINDLLKDQEQLDLKIWYRRDD